MENLDFSILLPAFAAGLLVLLTHVPLGMEVLRKGIIFIDLAIAQIAGLGVILAYSLGWDIHGWQVQFIAYGSAIIGAMGLYQLEKYCKESLEAIIGVIFILAASSGLLILAHNPHGGEYLRELLTGQILWVSWTQLIPILFLSVLILWYWFKLQTRFFKLGFYLVFAVAVTASVQLVGVYLVFSSLIIPALTVRGVNTYLIAVLLAYLVGIIGYASGLILSNYWDLPSGAVIVWTLLIVGIMVRLVLGWIRQKNSGDLSPPKGESIHDI